MADDGLQDLENLMEKLKGMEDDLPDMHEAVLKRLAGELMRSLKKNTPVDTGTLRRNWSLDTVEYETDKKGGRALVSNNTEYAEYVEYGHRQEVGKYIPKLGKQLVKPWVEGSFYVAKSTAELERKVDKVSQKALEKWLGDKLKDV